MFMANAAPDLDADVEAVMRVMQVLLGIATRSTADLPQELTLPQLRALVILDVSTTTVSGLAEQLGITPSTTTRLADRLVVKRLIRRQPGVEDRREVLLSLSPAGRRIVARVMRSRRQQIRDLLASLPEPDRRSSMRHALCALATAGEHAADGRVLDRI